MRASERVLYFYDFGGFLSPLFVLLRLYDAIMLAFSQFWILIGGFLTAFYRQSSRWCYYKWCRGSPCCVGSSEQLG